MTSPAVTVTPGIVELATLSAPPNVSQGHDDAEILAVQYPERQLANTLMEYGLPLIIITGSIGNTLALVVLMRRRMRCTSICWYLAMLAVADTCVLYLSAFKSWIRMLTGFEVLHVSSVLCKGTMLVLLVSWHMSAWLVVAMTVDRFVAVWLPLKASLMCKVYKARLVTAILFFIMLLINIHSTWTLHLHTSPHKSCSPDHTDKFMVKVYPYLKLLTYSLIPFLMVLVLNILIIFQLWRNRDCMDESQQQLQSGRLSRRSQNRVTFMLLAVTFTWLALTAPFMLWQLVTPNSNDPETEAKIFLFKVVCFLLMYTNHSINFYIYCITGKRFRQELADLFCHHDNVDRRSTWNQSAPGQRTQTTRFSLTSIRSRKSNGSPQDKSSFPKLNGCTK